LSRNRLEAVTAIGRARGDAGSLACRVAGVENVDRNILLDRGENSCRMQHLGAEVSEFRGLVEADYANAVRVRTNIGIRGHHAVDVSPDLYAAGSDPSAHNRRREIRTAAADRGGHTRARRAHETAH